MKNFKIDVDVQVLAENELDDQDRELVECAKKATRNSYAPYSQFHVGAAVRLGSGKIIIGANQENAAFPSGLCAERTAVFSAQAQYPEEPITALAIAASNAGGLTAKPVSPCGSCRQVILEIEERYKQPVRILLYGTNCIYVVRSIKDLLPLCFVDADMR